MNARGRTQFAPTVGIFNVGSIHESTLKKTKILFPVKETCGGFKMQTLNAWDLFFKSGRVEDYPNYCQQRYTYQKETKELADVEIFDRRTCDKRE